jgi:hypothetical protein
MSFFRSVNINGSRITIAVGIAKLKTLNEILAEAPSVM